MEDTLRFFDKIRNNIAVQIIAGVVSVLVILTAIVVVIGYQRFTEAIENQYANTAYHAAMTARDYIKPEILEYSGGNLSEWQHQYKFLQSELGALVKSQEATYVYAFTAEGKDYEDVTFLLNATNPLYSSSVFTSGHTIKQTDARYLSAFKAIYDEKAERTEIAVYRPANDKFTTGNHITVMIPVRRSNGEIFAILGVERRMEDLDEARTTYVNHVLRASGVFLLVIIVIYTLYLSKKIINPIKKIANEATRFARENTILSDENSLSRNIKTKNEIGKLAKTIDFMEKETINYIENLTHVMQEKEQIKTELSVATQIQADMLPRTFPPFPDRHEFEIYATMTPAKEVGGDFYDFFLIDEDHLALVIADVSGKGVPAALFMAISKTLIKTRTQSCDNNPSEVLHDVNNILCEGNEADLFVTVWLGILEISTGKLVAANAGHEYPAIKRKGGEYELLISKNSPAVATMEGMRFRQAEFELHPGDILYTYTDGVAEATDANKELYGTDRMIRDLNKTVNDAPEEILKSMKKSVDEFVGDAPQFDDITMLCLKYFGGKKS